MQPGQTAQYSCKACGHTFAAAPDLIAKQPTCPKCRTFGQLADARGKPVSARQNVVRVQHPGGGGSAPYAPKGGPVAYQQADNDYVEVAADVHYGKRTNTKALVNLVILFVLGLGIVGTLFFIVDALKEDRSDRLKQEKEVVLDPKEFERAVDESVGKVREMLKNLPDAQVQETTNFSEAIEAIRATGGVPPGWSTAPAPGTPFRTHGFVVKMPVEDRNNPGRIYTSVGFVMLIYYKSAGEVDAAKDEIDRYLSGDTRNYGSFSSPAMWFVGYMGVNYKGELKDGLSRALKLGPPATYKQFTDRVGATLRDDLK
jgi:hypothetical protein